MQSAQSNPSKRRRVVTSCSACRKVKARCETQSQASSCRRCYTLKIECELPERAPPYEARHDLAENSSDNSVENRLGRLEQMIAKLVEPSRSVPSPVVTQSTTEPTEDASAKLPVSPHHPHPVKIIRDLQREFFGKKDEIPIHHSKSLDLVATGLLSLYDANLLLETFVNHYGRWVSVTSVSDMTDPPEQQDPLLTSTACLLATRFVPHITRQCIHDVFVYVRRLSADAILNGPPLHRDTIRALTLLSMWSPATRTDLSLDNWLLSGTTASHAILAFKIDKVHDEADKERMKNLRLWGIICLTHLQYSIGNGRPLNISLRLIEKCSFLAKVNNPTLWDEGLVAEVSLYLTLHRIQSSEFSAQWLAGEHPELVEWQVKWRRLVDGAGPPTTLQLSWWFCRLLLNRSTLRNDDSESQALKTNALREGANIVSQIVRHHPSQARDFPDFTFFLAAYAALVLCENATDHHLVENLHRFLLQTAPNDDHIACRHAYIIERALQRNQAASDNTGILGADPDDSLDATLLAQQQSEIAFDGFDVFGELFSVDSLL